MSWLWALASGRGKISGSFSQITATPLTAFAWFKHEGGGTNDENIMCINDASSAVDYFRFGSEDGGTAIMALTGSTAEGVDDAISTTSVTDSIWNTYICTHSSSTLRDIYLNNAGAGQNTFDVTPSGLDNFCIGRELDNTDSDSWEGNLAEVAVWDVVISAGHRAMLQAGYSPLCLWDILPNLVIYEPLDSPVLNRYLLHSGSPTLTASSGGPDTGEGDGTSPVYAADHPRIIHPSAQILQFPSAAAVAGGTPRFLSLLGCGT